MRVVAWLSTAHSVHCRRKSLEDLQFEFDEDKAGWMRWYGELQKSTDDTMLGSGRGADFYLYNWCSTNSLSLQMLMNLSGL